MEINDFLTLDYLSTYMGCVVVTMLMVQFLKELPIIKSIQTKYFTFIVAFVNILLCKVLLGSFLINDLYLIFINSMMVTFTATGGYDFAVGKVKIKTENYNI